MSPRLSLPGANWDSLDWFQVGVTFFVVAGGVSSVFCSAITPGSANLIPKLIEQGLTDLDKAVNKLTLEEWVKIADTFEDWPFRPAVSPSLAPIPRPLTGHTTGDDPLTELLNVCATTSN